MLERLSLLLLVGGILFEIVTGVLNIQYDYMFGFSFYTAHYYRRLGVHRGVRGPRRDQAPDHGALAALPVAAGRAAHLARRHRSPRPATTTVWSPTDPDPPTLSRRGALALVGGGSLLVAVLTAGQTIGGFTRQAALLLPRGRSYGNGPNDFQVNRTAPAAGIIRADVGAAMAV